MVRGDLNHLIEKPLGVEHVGAEVLYQPLGTTRPLECAEAAPD